MPLRNRPQAMGDKPITGLRAGTNPADAVNKAQLDAASAAAALAYAPLIHTHAQSDVTGLVTALAGKEPTITAGTTADYWRGDKTWQPFPTTAASWSFKNKTADQSFTSNTTRADLTDLVIPVLANKTYLVRGVLNVTNGGNVGGVNVGITVPASPTRFLQSVVITSTTLNTLSGQSTPNAGVLYTQPSIGSNQGALIIDAILVNGANAGNITLQGAQNTSSATATTYGRGSFLAYYEVP